MTRGRIYDGQHRVRLTTRSMFVILLLVIPAMSWAQKAIVCSLVTIQEIAATSSVAVGKLASEGPSQLTAKQVAGLPASLAVEQCTGEVRTSGAVALRIGLLKAERELNAAEWQKAEKAVEDPKEAASPVQPLSIAGALCWQHSWGAKKVLHEVACSRIKGPFHLTIGFEHEDRSKLPPAAKVSDLLTLATTRLPAR